MVDNKIFAMHRRFGTCGVLRCEGCNHLITDNSHKRHFRKCELYGNTFSSATDWSAKYQACGMYNVPQDMTTWTPLIHQIGNRLSTCIEGQIEMEI